jgi:hypothetical protein
MLTPTSHVFGLKRRKKIAAPSVFLSISEAMKVLKTNCSNISVFMDIKH